MKYIKPLRRKFNQHLRDRWPLITGAKINTFANMTNINERILLIIKHFCEGNKAEFARTMEEKPQTINGWLNRKNGTNVINKILGKYPTINPAWLYTGEGEMLATDGKIKVNLLNTPIPMGSAVESPENAAKNENIQRMAISFEELMDKYEDMTAQRDYWRNKAAELEYKLAKLEAV